MLVPWLFAPTMLWLAVDMFGALVTHVHNGDPLNDSTGAIASLIRLFILATLWYLRPLRATEPRSARLVAARVGAVAALCLLAAMVGGVAMRQQPRAQAETGLNGLSKRVVRPVTPLRRNAITLQDRL
jgi:hypothetical protein